MLIIINKCGPKTRCEIETADRRRRRVDGRWPYKNAAEMLIELIIIQINGAVDAAATRYLPFINAALSCIYICIFSCSFFTIASFFIYSHAAHNYATSPLLATKTKNAARAHLAYGQKNVKQKKVTESPREDGQQKQDFFLRFDIWNLNTSVFFLFFVFYSLAVVI